MAAATAHVAGHPMAIRVGGRRMSQSNPIRSPTKAQQQTQTQTSTEDVPVEIPDYPRPHTPISMKNASEKPSVEKEEQEQESPNKNETGGGNRQERRKQERKKENHHHEENEVPFQSSLQRNDAMFNHLHKKNFDLNNQRGSNEYLQKGVRINQPAGKFMT